MKPWALSSRVRNVLGAAGVRVATILASLVTVRLLLELLGASDYGVWVTLTSLIAWIGMMDLGVGNSLRNSVAGLVDESRRATVQHEFVAFFRLLAALGAVAAVALAVASGWVPLLASHRTTSLLLYLPVLLGLPLLLGGSVMQGARQVGLQSLLQNANSGWMCLFLLLCTALAWRPSLPDLAGFWAVVYLSGLLWILARALRILQLPARRLLSRMSGTMPWERLKVGTSFLALQVATLVLYAMGNVLVYKHLGPSEVARYDVLNKIFQIGLSFFGIVISVVWPDIARLRASADFPALRRLYLKTLGLAAIFCLGAALVAWWAPAIVRLWTRGLVQVSHLEAMSLALLVSVQAVAYVGAVVLNAFEQVGVQVRLALVNILLMLPLAHLLFVNGSGLMSVPLAAAALTCLPLLVCHLQATRLMADR